MLINWTEWVRLGEDENVVSDEEDAAAEEVGRVDRVAACGATAQRPAGQGNDEVEREECESEGPLGAGTVAEALVRLGPLDNSL